MKNLLLSVLFSLFTAVAFGQDTFIKVIAEHNYGQNVRVIPTADAGWVICSLDSFKVFKFNSCGIMEWGKHYKIPYRYGNDFIKTKNGNYVILSTVPVNINVTVPQLTVLNQAGNVTWSKTYENLRFQQNPYTVSEDNTGNLMVYGNSTEISSNEVSQTILKVNPNGNLTWASFYKFSPFYSGIWGGAIVTSDGGMLIRTGTKFIKMNIAGNIQWVTDISAANYHYVTPLEVADGYIFTGYRPSSGIITFYKINLQGQLVGNSFKSAEFVGLPPRLFKNKSGNIAGVFQQQYVSNTLPTIIEFDKDLNLVKTSSLHIPAGVATITASEMGFFNDNSAIIAGSAQFPSGNISQALFFARTNTQFKTSCDTVIALPFFNEPAAQTFPIVNSVFETLTTVNHTNIPIIGFTLSSLTLCPVLPVRQVNIHQDSVLCEGGTLVLKNAPPDSFDSYLWSTGENTAAITVTKPGKYWLRAGYNCNSIFISDTVIVKQSAFPQPVLTQDSLICGGNPIVINAEIPGATYQWQDGSVNPIFRAALPGNYFVDVTVGSCTKRFSVTISEAEKLVMPNIFTPGTDGLNDVFKPETYCGIASGTLKIYNRWGQHIFTTSTPTNGWNGTENGKKLPAGVYYWHLQYTNFQNQTKQAKGWLQLMQE